MSIRCLIVAAVTGIAVFSAHALAGPLNPPTGPIASTPGAEPRVPINATTTPGDANSTFRITQPGSYYLTGNLQGASGKVGIRILSGNVTIDLMGYSLQGVAGSTDGILLDGDGSNITIRNGTVTGWGADGIDAGGTSLGYGGLFESLHLFNNQGDGLRAISNSMIRDCSFVANDENGLTTLTNATVINCDARANGEGGFNLGSACTITSSSSRLNGGVGILVIDGSVVSGCASFDNATRGIVAATGCEISRNAVASNGSNGIQVDDGCVVRENACSFQSTGGAGILVVGNDCRIEGNNCVRNSVGILVSAAGNFITRNTCSGSTNSNWVIVANNYCLVIEGAPAAAINGNAGGVSPGSTNPNANYTY